MKNLSKFVVALLVSVVMFGCGEKSQSPKEVTNAFMSALVKSDFDGASKHATENANKMILMLKGMKAKGDKVTPFKSFKLGKEVITGDKATVEMTVVKDSGKEKSDVQKLVKVDGKWLVDMEK